MNRMDHPPENPFLTPAGIARVAELARLRVAPEELAAWAAQMRRIVGHVDRLREIPEALLPESAPTFETTLRADDPCPGDGAEEIERNAGQRAHRHVMVPRVVEGGS